MLKRLEAIKHEARNSDKNDLRQVIEHLADIVSDLYVVFNGKPQEKAKVLKKKPAKSTKAKPKQLKNL